VLERVAETGNAQATFALAETYDPNVLATWRTYGTRSDGTKARDLYAKAYDGGIEAAKDRSDALGVGDGGQKPTSWFGRGGADH
jgi:TPR repeat protein